ncbi:hypothetical protein NIES4071_77750 [Calothrix sp. NIES-4071]|nr:hypothetical protein NIES4071_77750 [Calothrix sp. NIES-4071]BAZ62048.1 hypothetical protein NIES4105_77690 [Calothrix sp. NIES-4105]
MKNERERKQLIQDINILLNQAYDSILDDIYALLKRIDDEEEEDDLRAYDEGKEDIRLNGTVSWEEVKKEMKKEVV